MMLQRDQFFSRPTLQLIQGIVQNRLVRVYLSCGDSSYTSADCLVISAKQYQYLTRYPILFLCQCQQQMLGLDRRRSRSAGRTYGQFENAP
jgi:hypothetical protein